MYRTQAERPIYRDEVPLARGIRKNTVLKMVAITIVTAVISACSLFTPKNANTVLDIANIACLAAKVAIIDDDNAVLKACQIYGELEGPARQVIAEQRKSNASAIKAHAAACGKADTNGLK